MIDLHTHSLFSDGQLIPSELVRRAEAIGYTTLAITDHADTSTLDFMIPRLVQVAEDLNRSQTVKVIPGVELTHIPPVLLVTLIQRVRELGAKLVVVHGETIVEPVAPGTNRAALDGGADILAHPGLITEKEAQIAANKGVYLEISGRSGHSFTNGHVAKRAEATGARLLLNSDAHAPRDLLSASLAEKIVCGAGLPAGSYETLLSNAERIVERIRHRI
jgi:histidinol phosphatase-like PHP family hydrolase